MATVNSQPLLLQTLPAEIVAMVAEQLQKPGLCRFRATMNSELVNKTLHFFAKQTFSELNWQSKLMSQSALEELEEIADRPAFLPYVTALDFDLCYLHELKYWAHSIMHLAETKSTVQETARIRDSASQLSLFARDEEAFWQKPESWTRLSQLFSKFRALNQITTNASYGQQSNESGSVCHHPDVRRLQERYQISPEAWMPGTHIFHSHCCMEDISFRLLIAIARSGLQLKHMGTSVVEIHNVTFLNGLVRFEWLEPGKASKASKRASALNQWFSFMPNLRDLKLTGTGIDDWSRDYNLNLSEIR